jgi:hypothetical protein
VLFRGDSMHSALLGDAEQTRMKWKREGRALNGRDAQADGLFVDGGNTRRKQKRLHETALDGRDALVDGLHVLLGDRSWRDEVPRAHVVLVCVRGVHLLNAVECGCMRVCRGCACNGVNGGVHGDVCLGKWEGVRGGRDEVPRALTLYSLACAGLTCGQWCKGGFMAVYIGGWMELC